jgi:hypothetical protein
LGTQDSVLPRDLARKQSVSLDSGLLALIGRRYNTILSEGWRSTKYSLHWQNRGAVAVPRASNGCSREQDGAHRMGVDDA